MYPFYVFITINISKTLFVEITNNLYRIKLKKNTKLVYFEGVETYDSAVARRNEIRNSTRIKKMLIIQANNPELNDLSISFKRH